MPADSYGYTKHGYFYPYIRYKEKDAVKHASPHEYHAQYFAT